MQSIPDYKLDALFRAAMDAEAEVLASTAVSEGRMIERVGRALSRRRTRRLATLLLAAAVTVMGAGAIALGGSTLPPPLMPERSRSASATPEVSLPALGLPGARAGEAGEYGWTGKFGSFTGMHAVVGDSGSPGGFRQTQLTFAVEDDCFAYGSELEPVAVTVAGLDGAYVEPYEDPGVMFMPPPRGAATTGAYALAIGDRILCVYLTWDADTTQDELEASRQVLETLRAQHFGSDGIRITFTLPAGWDTG